MNVTFDDELQRLAELVAEQLAPRIAAAMATVDRSPSGWMDTKAAAKYAGCTVNALHKAMSSGDVQHRQETQGGKAWFKTDWIDEWRGL